MRRILAVAAAGVVGFLLVAPGAGAATEIGQPCVGNGIEANRTLLVFTGNGSPLLQPVTPEEPPQVITGWKVQVGTGVAPQQQRLEVYRVLNEAQDYRKEAESAPGTVREGVNVFATRIAVDSYTGYLGLYGPGGALACKSAPRSVSGFFEGAATGGETRNVKSATELGVPLMATIEDDRDHDGYGDVTQDKCPTSAAYQGECPPLDLHIKVEPTPRAIVVQVSVSTTASVEVFGQVGWNYKPKPGLKTAGDKPTRLIVSLQGPKRTVRPGKASSFRVPLPKAVLRRLSRLGPSESVRAKLTVAGTNLAGRETHSHLRVPLRGRGPSA
jgi:hypothetical protein